MFDKVTEKLYFLCVKIQTLTFRTVSAKGNIFFIHHTYLSCHYLFFTPIYFIFFVLCVILESFTIDYCGFVFVCSFPMLLFESRASSNRISRRILMRRLIFLQQLWPENPTYQVYVPGYHSTMPQQHLNGRARSVSPQEVQVASLSDHPRANSRGGILYAELQFPVTSNYGSMKKRSQRDRVQHGLDQGSTSGNTTATTSVNSGEPSPTNMMPHDQLGSMDSVHRYVPDFVAVSTRKTAV